MAHHHASRRIGVGDWTIASSQPFSRRLTELRRASETVHPALGALAGADVSKLNTKGYTNFLRTAAQVDREHGLGLAERGIVFGDEHTSGGANPPADHGDALAAAKPEPVGDQSPDPSRVGSVKDLVDRALLPGTGERKQYAALGTVSPEQAARLKADTGLDLAGYQGQEITASVIGYIDGYDDGEGAVRHCWADTLLRDDDGHYYAVRERYTRSSWEPNAEVTDETKKTRRISVRAAILWATTLTGDTQTLRQDAAVFFRQSKISGARALAVLKPDAKTITVPVTLDLNLYEKTLAMGAYDNRTDFSATVAHCLYGDVEAWLDTDDKPSPAQFLKRWLKEHPHEQLSAASPQAVGLELVLDEQACSLVERFLAETPYEFTNRDVVSGCVRQSLNMAFRDKELESSLHHAPRDRTFADNGWGYLEEEVYDARQRRLGLPEFDRSQDDAERMSYDEQANIRLGLLVPASPENSGTVASRLRYPNREPEPTALRPQRRHARTGDRRRGCCRACRGAGESPRWTAAPCRRLALRRGAHGGGRIANVLTRCADALEAAVAGKEGR